MVAFESSLDADELIDSEMIHDLEVFKTDATQSLPAAGVTRSRTLWTRLFEGPV